MKTGPESRLKFESNRSRLDELGAAASVLCAVHCALMPFVVGFLPLLGLGFLADERAEWVFVVATLGIGCFSLLPSYFRVHGESRPIQVFAVGVVLILLARLAFEDNARLETAGMVVGAMFVAAAHFTNQRLCHRFHCAHDHFLEPEVSEAGGD